MFFVLLCILSTKYLLLKPPSGSDGMSKDVCIERNDDRQNLHLKYGRSPCGGVD